MFEAITHIIKLFTDNTIKWTIKSATFIIIVLGLWFINNTFNFLHSFRTNNKLEQLERIGQLLRDSTLTQSQRQNLMTDRQNIFDHKTVLDYFSSFCDSLLSHISFTKRTSSYIQNTIITTSINSLTTSSISFKNYWLHFIFSNTFLLLLMLATPFLVYKEPNSSFKIKTVSILIIWVMVFTACWTMAYLLNFIPVIYNRPWINYIVDFIISTTFWIVLVILLNNNLKR